MPLGGGGGEGGGNDPQMEACVQPNAAHNSAGPVAEGLRLKTAAAAVREGIERERERETSAERRRYFTTLTYRPAAGPGRLVNMQHSVKTGSTDFLSTRQTQLMPSSRGWEPRLWPLLQSPGAAGSGNV